MAHSRRRMILRLLSCLLAESLACPAGNKGRISGVLASLLVVNPSLPLSPPCLPPSLPPCGPHCHSKQFRRDSFFKSSPLKKSGTRNTLFARCATRTSTCAPGWSSRSTTSASACSRTRTWRAPSASGRLGLHFDSGQGLHMKCF